MAGERVMVNLGSGEIGSGGVPQFFNGWRQLRVDVEPATRPDIVASLTDLSAIASGSADCVWASHCIEHLYLHEVITALSEMRRILSDTGFMCVRVPDLQTVAEYVSADRLHEVLYISNAGPITAHDVIFGYGEDIKKGRPWMAHRSGFTPTLMMQSLKDAKFDSFLVRRSPHLELITLARKGPWRSETEASELLSALGL